MPSGPGAFGAYSSYPRGPVLRLAASLLSPLPLARVSPSANALPAAPAWKGKSSIAGLSSVAWRKTLALSDWDVREERGGRGLTHGNS